VGGRLTPASRGGNGRSGIVYWDNEGGAASPVVRTYSSRDTAIMDPPTWFTAVPASMQVDAEPGAVADWLSSDHSPAAKNPVRGGPLAGALGGRRAARPPPCRRQCGPSWPGVAGAIASGSRAGLPFQSFTTPLCTSAGPPLRRRSATRA
jgi:hypothetical protein